MVKFIVRRLLLMLLTMFIVSVLIFVVVEISPGNIARNVLGAYVTPEQEASYLAQLGLDRPLHIRYVSWMLGSDWQVQNKTGLNLVRIKTERGFIEWWAEDVDGTLVQWKLDGVDLIASRRQPDGSFTRVVDNGRWQKQPDGSRTFWGVDHDNRAVKWVVGANMVPTGGIDLVFSDGSMLSRTELTDTEGFSVKLNAGAREPGNIPPDNWIIREIDLSSLGGKTLTAINLGFDYSDTETDFPIDLNVYVDQVEIIDSDGEIVWQGGFDPFSATYSGALVEPTKSAITGGVVGADEEEISSEAGKLFKVSGLVNEASPTVIFRLFEGLDVTLEEGSQLRYGIHFALPSSGETVYEFGIAGFTVKRGGPVKYLPLQKGFLRGDPGESIKTGRPVMETLFRRLRNSVLLTAVAFVIIMPIALVLGVLAGLNEGTLLDRGLSIFGLITTGTPDFATGVILILIFSSWLGLLPGATVFRSDNAIFANPKMLVLPVLTLALVEVGYVLRITRASVVEVMREHYVRVASLKGLPYRRIVFKHVLRNAMIAPITVITLHVNWLIGGLVVVEAIFGFPGLGRTLYDAAVFKDVFMIEAGAMVMVMVAAGTQLVADVIYMFLNPRIRYE